MKGLETYQIQISDKNDSIKEQKSQCGWGSEDGEMWGEDETWEVTRNHLKEAKLGQLLSYLEEFVIKLVLETRERRPIKDDSSPGLRLEKINSW
jgi:hypothetical protein